MDGEETWLLVAQQPFLPAPMFPSRPLPTPNRPTRLLEQPSSFEEYAIESLPAYEEPVAAEAPVPFMRPPPAGEPVCDLSTGRQADRRARPSAADVHATWTRGFINT